MPQSITVILIFLCYVSIMTGSPSLLALKVFPWKCEKWAESPNPVTPPPPPPPAFSLMDTETDFQKPETNVNYDSTHEWSQVPLINSPRRKSSWAEWFKRSNCCAEEEMCLVVEPFLRKEISFDASKLLAAVSFSPAERNRSNKL